MIWLIDNRHKLFASKRVDDVQILDPIWFAVIGRGLALISVTQRPTHIIANIPKLTVAIRNPNLLAGNRKHKDLDRVRTSGFHLSLLSFG